MGIFTDKDPEAQEGTRWARGHVTRRWPTWSLRCGVLTARQHVLCVLSSPPTASTEAQSQEELLF